MNLRDQLKAMEERAIRAEDERDRLAKRLAIVEEHYAASNDLVRVAVEAAMVRDTEACRDTDR